MTNFFGVLDDFQLDDLSADGDQAETYVFDFDAENDSSNSSSTEENNNDG